MAAVAFLKTIRGINRLGYELSLRLVPSPKEPSATTTFKAALKDSGTCGSGPAEESGTLQQTGQGCVEASLDPTDHSPLSDLMTARYLCGRGFVILEGVDDGLLEGHLPPSLPSLIEGGFAENRTCLGYGALL